MSEPMMVEPKNDAPVETAEYVRLLDEVRICEQSHAQALKASRGASRDEVQCAHRLNAARKAFADYLVEHQPKLADEIKRRVR